MGRIALAVCVACLASSSFAVAQENKNDARQRDAHVVRVEGSSSQLTSEAINASVMRVAMRGAFANADQPKLSQQEALGLLLLFSSSPRHN